MTLKFTGNVAEMGYPFLYEESALCDFEILTDELCTVTGLALTQINDEEIRASLEQLQPKIFHLNGSIRGKNGIFEQDIEQLVSDYLFFKAKVTDNSKVFVLPRGQGAVIQLHYCRSLSKKVVRALAKVDKEGKSIPETVPRFANVLINYYFALTRLLNQYDGIDEPEYESINYPIRKKS